MRTIWCASDLDRGEALIFSTSLFNSARAHAVLLRGSFCILEFGWRQPRREKGQHGLGDLLGVDAWFAMHAILNALQECAAAFGYHMSGRVPSLVVEATQQGGKHAPI